MIKIKIEFKLKLDSEMLKSGFGNEFQNNIKIIAFYYSQ